MQELNIQIFPSPKDNPFKGKVVRLRSGKDVLRLSFDCHQLDSHREELKKWLLSCPGKVDYKLHLSETGGGATNTGYATIICGIDGEPLVSVWGSPRCNDNHANFFVREALVVTYSHHRGNGSGKVSRVKIDDKDLKIVVDHLYEYEHNEIVVCDEARQNGFAWEIDFPQKAFKAARQKSMDYHCRSAFYVKEGGATGPSGALRGAGAANGGMPSPLKGPGIGY